jgi:hypothetical protein
VGHLQLQVPLPLPSPLPSILNSSSRHSVFRDGPRTQPTYPRVPTQIPDSQQVENGVKVSDADAFSGDSDYQPHQKTEKQ